jgi:hypothetical protein
MTGAEVLVKLCVQRVQKDAACLLPLPFLTVPTALARTGVKDGQAIEGTGRASTRARAGWAYAAAGLARSERDALAAAERSARPPTTRPYPEVDWHAPH